MANLDRFLKAQEKIYSVALSEVKNGQKESCWMWYMFPQLKGLGASYSSQYYGIADIEEAREYLKHPILGKRLREMCVALLNCKTSNPEKIFGYPDNLKLRSCMTLFAEISGKNSLYRKVLDKFFDGKKDELTLQMLRGGKT